MRVSDQRPTRVLLVEEVGLGGFAEYTDELARALAEAGCEVALATGRDHASAAIPGVTIHRLFPYVRETSRVGRLVRRARLARPLNGATHLAGYFAAAALGRGCDVIHVQGEEWPPLAAVRALLLRATGRPVVYTPHNTFDRGTRSHPRAHHLIRRCAARIVVHSEYDLRALPAAAGRKAAVIPHGEYGGLARRGGLDVDAETVRAEFGIGRDELAVLLFGQLRRDKGARDLLTAALEVEGAHVVLAGEDRGALGEVADLLDDRRLRGRVLALPGFAADELVGRLFAAADVVALPYPKASASGVLLLAYAYGRPVVGYPVGGLPEYIRDGQTGWLCERADTAALTETLRAIETAGREECRTRGEQAKRFSEDRFGWGTIARKTIALYREAIRSYE